MADFEKDFGYLMPFLDRVQQEASKVGGDELKSLLKDESQKWQRIRQLLSQKDGAASPTKKTSQPAKAEAEAPVKMLTVGSLRRS
jgi:hypothetical protein